MPHIREVAKLPRPVVTARRREDVALWLSRLTALGRQPKVVIYSRGDQSLLTLRRYAAREGLSVSALIVDTEPDTDPANRQGWQSVVQHNAQGRAHGVLLGSPQDLSPSFSHFAHWVNTARIRSWFIELAEPVLVTDTEVR